MPNPTILLADDDEVFLENAREFLLAHHYDVVCTTEPAEAKRLLQDTPVALAFLDIQFDPTDDRDEIGLKVALDTMDLSSVPKIILTKLDDRADYVRRSLRPRQDGKAAAVDFINKRDGLDKLLEVIENNLNRARIFLSYVRADRPAVDSIYQSLASAGFIPWIDKKGIPGGRTWKREISKAIRATDFFVVCLSRKSFVKPGYFHKEISLAFEVFDEMPPDLIYLVPVRLEECDITHDRLSEIQWVDLFTQEALQGNQDGFHDLVRAIKLGMSQRRGGGI